MMSSNDVMFPTPADEPTAPYTYVVASIEKMSAPDGANGQDWYRYVLKSGRSMIAGQRRGSRQDVQHYATQCAEQLNARALEGKSMWSPRGRKPANAV